MLERAKRLPELLFEWGVMRNKRTFQLDREPVNLEDDDVPNTNPIFDPLATNMQRLFLNDPIRRPPDNELSKKSQRSSGSSDVATSSRSSKEQTFETLRKTAKIFNTFIIAFPDSPISQANFR